MFGKRKNEELQNIDWYCNNCNEYLNSQSGFYVDCGSWSCTTCGHSSSITVDEIIWDDDTGEDDYDDILSNPGCTACGNPTYPNCKSSCPMFDD